MSNPLQALLLLSKSESDESVDLTPSVCMELLSEGETTEVSGVATGGSCFFGYPVSPLYIRVADNLSYWMLTK